MTEAEWLTCVNPGGMLRSLKGKASDRKFRLFACACGRNVWQRLNDERSRKAVEIAEEHADGRESAENLLRAYVDAGRASRQEMDNWPSVLAATKEAINAALGASQATMAAMLHANYGNMPHVWIEPPSWKIPPSVLTALVRDIFVNPFRPLAVDAIWFSWCDGAIQKLAQSAYDERSLPHGHLDAERLAILADTLEEAECTEEQLLGHLRGPGPHVRGCWAVDLLLARV